MTEDAYEFDCPECEHTREHRTKIGGFLHVTRHFFFSHGWYSFKVGMPYVDVEPPDFEE